MSQENIEIVRRGFAAWDRQDYEQAASLFSSDVEIDASDLELNPAVYVGIDGARSFRNEIDEVWGEFSVEIEDLLPVGDEVVVFVRASAHGRISGARVDSRGTWVVRVREGKVKRLRLYRDRGDALEAVGLSE